MKRKRVFTLIIFVMLLLLNLNNYPSSANFAPTTRIWTILDEPQPEFCANETTQVDLTLVDVFDNTSEINTQTNRVFFSSNGLNDLGYDLYVKEGTVFTYSCLEVPYYFYGSFGDLNFYGDALLCYAPVNYPSTHSFKNIYGGVIFLSSNLTLIEDIFHSTMGSMFSDLEMPSYFGIPIYPQYSNQTINDVLYLNYYCNSTDFQGTFTDLSDDILHELYCDWVINLESGLTMNYTINYYQNDELLYNWSIVSGEPYNNDEIDYVSIDYPTEISEGEKINVSVVAYDTAYAYSQVSFRLLGDEEWVILDPFLLQYGVGKYLMDGIYELNITVYCYQPVKYEQITLLTIIEDLPLLNEIFPIFAILFVNTIILFRSKKKQKMKK